MSRGDPPKRGRGAGEPPGSRKGGPGPKARARVMGSRPSHRVRSYLANSMLATGGSVHSLPGALSIHASVRGGKAPDSPTFKPLSLGLPATEGSGESRAWSHRALAEPGARNPETAVRVTALRYGLCRPTTAPRLPAPTRMRSTGSPADGKPHGRVTRI